MTRIKALDPATFVRALKGILDGKVDLPESLADNPVLQVLLRRRSVRSFTSKPIPEDVFRVILEAGRVAPSTVNLQSWSFGLFDADSWKKRFGTPIPFKARRAVVICADMHRVGKSITEFPFKPLVQYTLGVMNASIAAYAMNIAAEACGVGSVMLSDTGKSGFYDGLYLKEKLGLPDGVVPIMTIVFGYPRGKSMAMPPKLPLPAVTFEGRYKPADRKALKDWLDQMMAGYRALYITRSFKGQLRHYRSKSDSAEKGLKEMIFYKEEE